MLVTFFAEVPPCLPHRPWSQRARFGPRKLHSDLEVPELYSRNTSLDRKSQTQEVMRARL